MLRKSEILRAQSITSCHILFSLNFSGRRILFRNVQRLTERSAERLKNARENVVHVRGSDRKSAKHASASVATLVQRVNDFSPHPAKRKRVRNEFEARVDRFVIAVDSLFAKRLFLLARLSRSSFIYRFYAVPSQTASCTLLSSRSRS